MSRAPVNRAEARRQAQHILAGPTDTDGFNMASYVIRLCDELDGCENRHRQTERELNQYILRECIKRKPVAQ